ncbi:DnaJ domain-containing protein [Flavobacterium sp. JP2137]|uniref:J domain-containing protein n=1 Tax=Flavobacterium sp. JP2137 TaxID=3414510 RepID=UPI003D2FBB81
MKDYYKTLGIPRTATTAEIKSAYRKLSLLYHPDRNNGEDKFNALFSEINEAYQTLYSADKRSNYDQLWANKGSRPRQDYRSYQQEQSYIQPIIERFYVDKIFFRPGEIVTITWNVLHAHTIELRPFGFVEAQGVKKIKINQSNLHLEINLIAFNQVSKRYYSSRILLENINHPQSQNYSKRATTQFDSKNKLKEFFSLEGNLDRFSYFKRLFLLFLLFIGFNFLLKFYLAPLEGLMTLVYLFCFIGTVIQTAKRLNAISLSWYFCILLLIPYVNLLLVILLLLIPSTTKKEV